MNKRIFLLLLLLTQSTLIVFARTTHLQQQVPVSNDAGKDTAVVMQLLRQGKAQLEPGGDFPKAMEYAQKADSLSQRIGYLKGEGESALLMAGCLKRLDKFEEAVPFLKKAEAIFEQIHSTDDLIRTYSLRGAVDLDLSLRAACYEKALALLKANGDKQGIAAVLPDYSEVKMMQAQLPAAEDMLKESIRLSKELGIDRIQWQYGLLGAVQIQRRESVEALKNELLAIKIGEQYGDTSSHMAEIYNYTAIIYMKMGKLEESGQYLHKAIGTGSHAQDPMLTVQFRSNLANILIRQNKPKEALENLKILEKTYGQGLPVNAKIQMLTRFVRCYTELNDLSSAGRYAEQLIKYSDSMKPDEYDQIAIYTELNRFLIASGQYERASRFVEQHRLIAEKFKLPDQSTQAYFYKFRIDSACGDLAPALRYFQLYTKGKDAVFNENTAKQLNQLHVEFETEKKDKEIILKEKNIQILVQQAALQKALSDKSDQELALNRQALQLKQKDFITEKQQVELLTKQTQLQNAASEKQQQELVIRQKDITLLKQSNRIQESDLKRASMVRNVIISGALVLGLMSLLVYSRYRTKKRASEKLALQQEEIRQKNISLQALISDKDKLLMEKEWLVKEVHHRVKNNLQMVISLLNSQSAYLSNQDAVAAIRESQRRMHAMSLIHQRLYEKDESTIDMQTYITDLVNYLKDSFEGANVRFVLDLQPLVLDVSKAVPLGLILNEAITNSLKYAFPDGQAGHILVSLKPVSPLMELIIADDGIGLSGNNMATPKKSLGMSLLKGLTTQIGGTYDISSGRGVEILIRFSPAQIGKSVLNDTVV
ncbi:two-component sensor histidine kinase [Chitinophaga niastensis]|uniref:histidine kinase n=1 Tax=Chitinophaga niastensis TaxID=536980 RepID=A0A2P8H9Y7_CHINA|nr:histidine kinase dimerization/phosphoacceptor domain -containing protein [Chitinophaga niastensis]PSL43011.1 two-component sensor histidine kinase [Chitinophaga niastensis]